MQFTLTHTNILEQHIIGACLIRPELMQLVDHVDHYVFHSWACRFIWCVMCCNSIHGEQITNEAILQEFADNHHRYEHGRYCDLSTVRLTMLASLKGTPPGSANPDWIEAACAELISRRMQNNN